MPLKQLPMKGNEQKNSVGIIFIIVYFLCSRLVISIMGASGSLTLHGILDQRWLRLYNTNIFDLLFLFSAIYNIVSKYCPGIPLSFNMWLHYILLCKIFFVAMFRNELITKILERDKFGTIINFD